MCIIKDNNDFTNPNCAHNTEFNSNTAIVEVDTMCYRKFCFFVFQNCITRFDIFQFRTKLKYY